ncbi:hypothetical protein [Kocuria sabuli]|uniref:hypothetical protein n=1 Tax=Kocuria sabuli TaxID=3071448 RepID=UPI0034D3BF2F
MPPLMPVEAFSGPSAVNPLLWVIGAAVAVVCVVILVRLYRPKHLDERTGADGGTAAGGSTAGVWGYSPGDAGGGFDGDGGGGQC